MSEETRLLFDAPGPRGRRRIRLATGLVVVLLALLAWAALRQFAAHGQLASAKWQPFTQWPVARFLLVGLLDTLEATAVSAAIGLPLGGLVALARLSHRRPLSLVAACYTELFRSVPVLLLILVFLLALPRAGLTLPLFWQLVAPIVISGSATTAEIVRAGVLSLERGQTEAAYSLGLTHGQAMRLIVLPQVVRRLLPALVTQLVSLLKDTTLGYVVSYSELLHQGQTLGEYTGDLVQTYLVVAAIYIIANGALSQLATSLDRYQRRAARRQARASTASGMDPLDRVLTEAGQRA